MYYINHNCIITCILCLGGATVNSVNNEGATPLYIASKEGHNGLIQTLLNARANVNMPCEKGEQHTPLIAATAAEQFDVVKLLLKVLRLF